MTFKGFRSVFFLAAFAAMLQTGVAVAQDAGDDAGDWRVETGAGVIFSPDYEGSDDYEASPVPVLEVSWKDRIALTTKGGPGLIATPFLGENYRIDTGLRYDFGRDEDDNDALRGLGDLDVGAVGVLKASYEFGQFETGVELGHDLGGDRDGTTATVEFGMTQPILDRRAFVGLTADATWASDDYMQNTFGISATQAARSGAGLSAFDAEAGFKDVGLSAMVGYSVTENVSVITMAKYSRLLNDAADSPLVDREGSANQFQLFLGASYRW
ncbi:MipA/OmpV family protein [Hwanghaeella grinnelliae]|uniref:MipA/OmpV family protein n=1 Tax=Hwanghaeella grinnelliae TaxID=2500179 RepID=A0A3S2VPY3_9PROT|nr:MipA/OmpV family protein [Hwanghaeella grinnelliae]RVU36697.1 MipA/OmpV family protein [Hwanghaeella grinnelliae]